MNIRKVIQERLRARLRGVQADGDVNAVVAANVGERGAVTTASSSADRPAEGREEPPREPA